MSSLSLKRGIQLSRYAPQNINKPENVAFRYSSVNHKISTSNLKTTTTTITTSTSIVQTPPVFRPTDQLPYKIQHRVLTAIQTLMEESCYDFASIWLPHVLIEENWTCSEAVEMAKWKTVLSRPLPDDSITLSGRYSLKLRLTEAVQIRNITAHREHCDNNAIRTMITSAQNLVEIFKDMERWGKLERLRGEIAEWEASKGEVGVSRRKLHDALGEIVDNAVVFDEMDWALEEDVSDEIEGEEMDWE